MQAAFISERHPDAKPARHGFLTRNKTNAALGEGIIIVAAGSSSGTKSQFRNAVEQDIRMFVLYKAYGFEPFEGIQDMLYHDADVTEVHSAEEVISHISRNESARATNDTGESEQSSLDEWESAD